MTGGEWFLLIVRWLHLLAGTAWVGGNIFFLLALRPALRDAPQEGMLNRLVGQEFRNLVDVSITALLATGTVLSITRITTGYSTPAYGVVLGAKIALSVWMFYLVWFRQRRRPQDASREGGWTTHLSANNLLLALGVAVLLLADLLRALYENALSG